MAPPTSVDGNPPYGPVPAEDLHSASMGPPTSVDGNARPHGRTSSPGWRFNRAADERRRKLRDMQRALDRALRLQWGRRRASTETRQGPARRAGGGGASMGPPTS